MVGNWVRIAGSRPLESGVAEEVASMMPPYEAVIEKGIGYVGIKIMNYTRFLQLLEHRREPGKLLGTGSMVPLVDVAPYRSSDHARKAPATCTWSRER